MPSIGSTTQVTVPAAALPPRSSPTTGSPGRSCASRSRTSASSAVSADVTTSVGVLFVDTPGRPARPRRRRPPRRSHGRGSVRRCATASTTTRSATARSARGSAGSAVAGAPSLGTAGRRRLVALRSPRHPTTRRSPTATPATIGARSGGGPRRPGPLRSDRPAQRGTQDGRDADEPRHAPLQWPSARPGTAATGVRPRAPRAATGRASNEHIGGRRSAPGTDERTVARGPRWQPQTPQPAPTRPSTRRRVPHPAAPAVPRPRRRQTGSRRPPVAERPRRRRRPAAKAAPRRRPRRRPRSGPAGAADVDEPTELDGADLELDGAPDVARPRGTCDVLDPALDTELDTELEGVPEAEADSADDDEDDDDRRRGGRRRGREVEAGPVGAHRALPRPLVDPAEVGRLRLGRGGVRGAAAGPQGRRAHRVGRLRPGLPQADRQGRAAQRRGGGRARQADRGRPLRGRAAAPGDGVAARRSPRSCAATCAGSSATASARRTTCSRPTCGSSSRWPSATPAAAWRSWT